MKEILKKYKIQPSKRLGQNFLIDHGVLEEIIQAADLKLDDIVLEIGPGLGILTIELAKRVKKVIAIEKDKRMCEILKKALKNYKNVEIINKDILDVGYSTSHIKHYKLVANLPYYITSPVIRKFLEAENKPKLMILMVQKEVGQRICSQPPKMSLLSVAVQFYAKPGIISYVSKKSFYPQPKVDSAIIKIIPKLIPKINTEGFFKLVKAGFSSKRKFLINNLSRELKIENYKLKIVFDQIELGQKLRAENLSIKDWLKLYEIFKAQS
ncbi:MAG: ribosomal RNA small subunit methyltransferase A [Candidatus Portnoybacteria bacterium]|nr:ribosomal RNA small subunit methyltransferase A [Candidatus Portnoybacteria bacterium]